MRTLASAVDNVGSVQEVLSAWKGKEVVLSSYTQSHSVLELCVGRLELGLRIECLDVWEIRAPVAWPSSCLEIREMEGSRGRFNLVERLFLLQDQGAKVKIVCGEVVLFGLDSALSTPSI